MNEREIILIIPMSLCNFYQAFTSSLGLINYLVISYFTIFMDISEQSLLIDT